MATEIATTLMNAGITVGKKSGPDIAAKYASALERSAQQALKTELKALEQAGITLKLKTKWYDAAKDYISIRFLDGKGQPQKIAMERGTTDIATFLDEVKQKAEAIKKLVRDHHQAGSIAHSKEPAKYAKFFEENGAGTQLRDNFPENTQIKIKRAPGWQFWRRHEKSIKVQAPGKYQNYVVRKPPGQDADTFLKMGEAPTSGPERLLSTYEGTLNHQGKYTYRQVIKKGEAVKATAQEAANEVHQASQEVAVAGSQGHGYYQPAWDALDKAKNEELVQRVARDESDLTGGVYHRLQTQLQTSSAKAEALKQGVYEHADQFEKTAEASPSMQKALLRQAEESHPVRQGLVQLDDALEQHETVLESLQPQAERFLSVQDNVRAKTIGFMDAKEQLAKEADAIAPKTYQEKLGQYNEDFTKARAKALANGAAEETGSQGGQQAPGFFAGSKNPLKWNWGNLFGG